MSVMTTDIFFGEMIKITMLKNANAMMNKVRRVQELRRSNAATPIKSKKLYSRKKKHKNKSE